MEALAIIAVVNCFISPILLAALAGLGYYFFKTYRDWGNKKTRYNERIQLLSRTTHNAARELWFEEVQGNHYSNELEVEAKFLFPLMRYLGYSANDLRMRVTTTIRVGRQDANGIADWVVYQNEKPVLVIETKEPKQALNQEVQAQARSYCFAMNVPAYLLANGREIQVCKRGVESDLLVFQCETEHLSSKWGELRRVAGMPEA